MSSLNAILCKNLSSVAKIVSEIWLLECPKLISNGYCRERLNIKAFVIFQYYLSFLQIPVVDIFQTAYCMQLCKNLSSVPQIVSEIWLLEGPKLISNGYCRERPKIKVFVIFQYYLSFLQIPVVDIFQTAC